MQKQPDVSPNGLTSSRSPNQRRDRDPNTLTVAQAAISMSLQGFVVVPLFHGTKKPAVAWRMGSPTRMESPYDVGRYWRKFPDHDVAIVVGPRVIMLDADTPEAEARLHEIEDAHDLRPNVVVRTKKGLHEYYALAEGVRATMDALDSMTNPAGIDVRTGESLAIIPPSTDKSIELCEATSVDDLAVAGQGFVDAISRNNGREPTQLPALPPVLQQPLPAVTDHFEIQLLLQQIDPDAGYNDWVRVAMAIHHETSGSQIGFTLFHDWSARGAKYQGRHDVESKWKSLRLDREDPVTIATLKMMANGAHPELLLPAPPGAADGGNDDVPEHELVPYSLRGQSHQFEALLAEQTYALGNVAISGQWTVIYAPPNTGKTLLTLHLLLQSIKARTLNPDRLFYVNADDNFRGLAEKLAIAEEFGFHMLAPGHSGFKPETLLSLFGPMAASGSAASTVIVLDTLKKFVDLMDKKQCTAFGSAVRPYTLRGGTLICLAHVNKHRQKGKAVYAGVSDILDDADCGYILDTADDGNGWRTVRFENKKMRGNVAEKAAYCYRTGGGIEYRELLDSVKTVDEQALEELVDASSGDTEIIEQIRSEIEGGTTVRSHLIDTVREAEGRSRRQVEVILDLHTVGNGGRDLWQCTRGQHNARVYSLLDEADPEEDPPRLEGDE